MFVLCILHFLVVLDQHKPLLAEAALYRQAVLARHVNSITDQSRDDIKVSVLADLQENQDKEGRILSEQLAEMVSRQLQLTS